MEIILKKKLEQTVRPPEYDRKGSDYGYSIPSQIRKYSNTNFK